MILRTERNIENNSKEQIDKFLPFPPSFTFCLLPLMFQAFVLMFLTSNYVQNEFEPFGRFFKPFYLITEHTKIQKNVGTCVSQIKNVPRILKKPCYLTFNPMNK